MRDEGREVLADEAMQRGVLRYLACGDFYRGFVRCRCDVCRHDVLVSLSCKQRGLCPSCGARRMCDVAANVTDPDTKTGRLSMAISDGDGGLARDDDHHRAAGTHRYRRATIPGSRQ